MGDLSAVEVTVRVYLDDFAPAPAFSVPAPVALLECLSDHRREALALGPRDDRLLAMEHCCGRRPEVEETRPWRADRKTGLLTSDLIDLRIASGSGGGGRDQVPGPG